MKKNIIITVILFLLVNLTKAQEFYHASSGEMIFSFSNITEYNKITEKYDKIPTGMRFTIWFHAQHTFHYNFNNTFGAFIGLGIRNIGITPAPDSVYFHGDKTYYKRASAGASVFQLTTVKQRTYTLGIPLAFKIGNFNKGYYLFAGAEYEYSFHYKEKVWIDNEKKKYSEWFGDQATLFLPSVFGGIKLPGGTMIKFKWYLQNFLNQNHKANIVNNNITTEIEPYKYTNTQLFYVSMAFIIESKKPKAKPTQENGQPTVPKIDM